MNICFVDNTDFKYDGDSIYSHKLRGAESVVINLSNALKVLGHKVTVINNCVKTKQIDGVSWIDIKSIKKAARKGVEKELVKRVDEILDKGQIILNSESLVL